MNGKTCATSDIAKAWDSIDWNKARAYVKKLQMRIVKAHQQGRTGKVKSCGCHTLLDVLPKRVRTKQRQQA